MRPLSQLQMNSDGNSGDVTDDCSDKEVDKFRQLLSENDYALLMRECRKEYQKPKPLRQQIKTLLKKSFANRQKEIEKNGSRRSADDEFHYGGLAMLPTG